LSAATLSSIAGQQRRQREDNRAEALAQHEHVRHGVEVFGAKARPGAARGDAISSEDEDAPWGPQAARTRFQYRRTE